MRVKFKVFNDIVFGLKYCNVVKKSSLVVEKYEEIMGTFAPTNQIGFFARGSYKGKSMFIDNDGIVHF
jgi:Rho GDP-dissociation inhibitor